MSFSRHQLRAARALLVLNQEALAFVSKVGITTIRKFENGHEVEPEIVRKLLRAVEAEGALLIPEGTVADGETTGAGVALRPAATLPPLTRARLAEVDTVGGVPAPAGKGRGKRLRASDNLSPGWGGKVTEPPSAPPRPPASEDGE